MENYPSNSHKSRLAAEKDIQKPEEKRVAGKVITGSVRTEKKSWLRRYSAFSRRMIFLT